MSAAEVLEPQPAEDVPTGRFGHPIPQPQPITAAQQAQHRTEIRAALCNWQWADDPSLSTTRRAQRLARRAT